jgi:hypothetical protein
MGFQLAATLSDLVDQCQARHRLRLGWGVGIAMGSAALGAVELEGRYDYWAVGPVVDRAGALAQQADDAVLIDGDVATAAADNIEVIHLDPVTESHPGGAYRVLKLRAGESG